MNRILALGALICAGVFAYVVGVRMSTEGMAVVIGVAFGVMASIPTSLIIAGVMRKANSETRSASPQVSPAPPMIVVTTPPPALQNQMNWQQPSRLESPATMQTRPVTRRFRVIGDAGEEEI